MAIAAQIQRLGKHSAIYGLGGLVQRIVAVLLFPLYTRYLSPSDYGAIEALVALSAVALRAAPGGDPELVLPLLLPGRGRAGAAGRRPHVVLVHDGRGDDRARRWASCSPSPISTAIFGTSGYANLVRAAFVGLWASMNYDQLMALFRVEERSVSYSIASLANVLLTVGATVLLVVVLDKGPLGVLVGNFSGTLSRLPVLLAYRRDATRARVRSRRSSAG